MECIILTSGVILSAGFAVFARQKNKTKAYAILKPLTTLLIISIAFMIWAETGSLYSKIIIAALFFSLAGDVFLLRTEYFLYGLIAFFFAHIGFMRAFISLFGFAREALPLIILVFIGSLYYLFLKKSLGKYSIPVAAYMAVILLMDWQALSLLYHSREYAAWLIAGGAVLFSFSDSIIAYNKFKKPFNSAEIFILSTYWVSIYLFTTAGWYINN